MSFNYSKMDIDENKICRLCFAIAETHSGFETMRGTTKEMLNYIHLNLDLAISNDPLICGKCAGDLKRCFDYKVACRSICKRMTQFAHTENGNENTMNILEDHRICFLCMKLAKNGLFVFIDKEDMINIREFIGKYFSAVELNCAREPVICVPCYEFLQHYSAFTSRCLSVEEKIQQYCKVEGTSNKGHVKLGVVLFFKSKNVVKSEDGFYSADSVKIEELYRGEGGNINMTAKIKNESGVKVEEKAFELKEEENVKVELSDCDSFQDNVLSLQLKEESELVPCEKRFKCDLCPYQTKRKKDLKDHLLTHKSMSEVPVYKCDVCDYQAKRKYSVERHKLNHKSISEVTMYKCELCTYQTKHKSNLQQHVLNHNRPDQAIYKCEMCEYRSNYKTNIHKHMLIHKSTAEVSMYNCTLCPYQTKHNCNLQVHILAHKNNSEVAMYKCENCEFQTKYKNNLRVHVQIHKSVNELTMYKCELCEYQAKRRSDVRRHMLTHKITTPLTTYKCEMCVYRARYWSNLQRHMLTHKNESEVTMHKCDVCEFRTKYKSNLRIHMETH